MDMMDVRRMVMLAGALKKYIATGNPLTFNTNVAKPIRSMLIPFTPTQTGTGDPSPDNVRPVVGITGITAWRTGKNMLKVSAESYHQSNNCTYELTETGVKVTATREYARRLDVFRVVPGAKYTVSFKGIGTGDLNAVYIQKAATWVIGDRYSSVQLNGTKTEYTYTFTAETDIVAFGWCLTASATSGTMEISDLQLELADTATPFSPYTGESFPVVFPATGKNLLVLKENEMIPDGWYRKFPNPIKKGGTYTISCQHSFGGSGNAGARVCIVGNSTPKKALTPWEFGQNPNGNYSTFTLTEEEAQGEYILFECQGGGTTFEQFENAELQLEAGSTATAYEPFDNTVYGGTLDLISGVLSVDRVTETLKWEDGLYSTDLGDYVRKRFPLSHQPVDVSAVPEADLCSVAKQIAKYNTDELHFYVNATQKVAFVFLPEATADSFTFQICYHLATPQTIQLDPVTIAALVGDNTIWSDANGDLTAVYLKKG